jgi:hypothetical protein
MMIFAVSFILLSYSNTLWMFLLAAVVFAFGYGAIAGVYGYVIMWRMASIPIAVAIVITIVCRKQFAN